MASGGPRRRSFRWAWLVGRGAVLSAGLMIVLWFVDAVTPGLRSLEHHVMLVRGEPCIVGVRREFWSISVVRMNAGGFRPPLTPKKFDSTTGVARYDRFWNERAETYAGLCELGRPWPICRGVFVGLGEEQKFQNMLTWSFAGRKWSLPTGVYWPGALAWVVLLGLIGSAMWEAPKMAWRAIVRRRRARLGLCRRCGYSLEGIGGVCPECGRAVGG